MQPESGLESNFEALTTHYQQRRPAHDGVVEGEVSDPSDSALLHDSNDFQP